MSSTIGSSIAAGASHQFATYFDITDQWQLVLPTSSYLLGYVLGPIFFGPLSESYGRKWVMVSTFVRTVARQSFDSSLNNASPPANDFATLCVLRLFVGIGASSPISVVGG
jgi:MFS family permease